jgi:S1-C subfamily serine protease
LTHDARKVARLFPRSEFLTLLGAGAVAITLGGCRAGQSTLADTAARKAAEVPDDEAVAEIAALVGPSVVQVNVKAIQTSPFGTRDQAAPVPFGPRDQDRSGSGQSEEGVGSGVVYSEDGHIITGNHVVENADEVNVAFADGSTERGEVVGTDPSTDLAVVRVDRLNLPAASLGDSRKLVVGQLAVAIGSPSGFQSTVTSGVISGLGREVPAEYTGGRQEASLVGLIQTDAAISPGNSGGALANRDGEVIGINVAYLPAETGAESIAFAIPSDTAVSVADQLIENGEAVHPYLGASLSDLTSETARRFGVQVESRAVVVEVDPDGPAARAGISPEDVITAVGPTTVASSGDVLAALRDHAPGDSVRLAILRSGGELRIEVRLGERGNAPTS